MFRTSLSLCLAAVVAGSLLGCKKDCSPRPDCYSGTVVGVDCWNGFLIEVDGQYAIGAPLRVTSGDSLPRPNIIAAVNQLAPMGTVGQRIYFTYVNDANYQTPRWACPAMRAPINFPVPHLVLSNVSATPCSANPKQ
ncbi:MAG: hypothetical protein JWR44_1671 [Hymenobacter sp.]|jgi:hypothetical protein|nr:hypothetical protein [Hymenobacter sp.]